MGSFAKAIAQLGNVASARLAAPASAHTSRGILQTSQANKTGLSLLLDQTLKSGHDMKTFGLGTAASLSSVDRYARFTAGMLRVYGTMERSLDASSSPATRPLWTRFGESLRREPSLELDLADVATQELPVTPATQAYCAAIEAAAAADEADGGGRMIGHVYCRYFADLFGGQALGAPTYYALAPAVLPGAPRHYDFGEFGANRRESIEAPTLALALALPLALALAQALTRTLTRTRALTVPLTPAQTLALSMTSLSLSLARSAEPEPEPGAGAVRGVQRGWRGARFRGGAADHRGGDASGLRTQRGALLRGRPAVERRGARRRQHGRRVRTRKTARLAPAVYRPSVSSPGGGGLLRPPSRVSVNLVPLLWTGVPTTRQDHFRFFGAPACRVFPHHLIMRGGRRSRIITCVAVLQKRGGPACLPRRRRRTRCTRRRILRTRRRISSPGRPPPLEPR